MAVAFTLQVTEERGANQGSCTADIRQILDQAESPGFCGDHGPSETDTFGTLDYKHGDRLHQSNTLDSRDLVDSRLLGASLITRSPTFRPSLAHLVRHAQVIARVEHSYP